MCQAQFWVLNYKGNIICNTKLVLNLIFFFERVHYAFTETQLKLNLQLIYLSSIQCKNVIQTIISRI